MSHSTIKLLPIVIICSLLAFCLMVGCIICIYRAHIHRQRVGSSIDEEEKSVRRLTVERGRVIDRSQATPEPKVGHQNDDTREQYWNFPQEKSRNSRISWDLKYWPVSKYFMRSKSSSEATTRRPSRSEKIGDSVALGSGNKVTSEDRVRPVNMASDTNTRKKLSIDTALRSHPPTVLDRTIIQSLRKAYQEDPVIRSDGPLSHIAANRSGRRPSAPEFPTPKKKSSHKHRASETSNSYTPITPTRRSLERRPATAPSGTKGFHTAVEPQLPPIPPSLASSFIMPPLPPRPDTPPDAILSVRHSRKSSTNHSKSQHPRHHRSIPRSQPTVLPKLDTNMSRLSGMSFLDPATPSVETMSTITHYSIDSGTNYDGEVARSVTIVPGSKAKRTSIRPTTPTKRSRLEGYEGAEWSDTVPGLPEMVARVRNGSVRSGRDMTCL